MANMVVYWEHGVTDVVLEIAERLSTHVDCVHLRAVCQGWYVPHSSGHHPRQAPWLLLPRRAQYVNNQFVASDSVLYFYDPQQLKIRSCFGLPQCHRHTYIHGSSYGWLVLEYERRMWFYNPINRREIGSLPPMSSPPSIEIYNICCIRKVVLSCNPSIEGCVVMVLFQILSIWELGFCRIGDLQWTGLKMSRVGPDLLNFTFHNNSVYMLDQRHVVTVYDLQNPAVPVRTCSCSFAPVTANGIFYILLVEGGTEFGGVYLVRSFDFRVYKWTIDFRRFEIMTNRAIYCSREQCFDQKLEEEQRNNLIEASFEGNRVLIHWMDMENFNHGYITSLKINVATIGWPSWFKPSLM